MSIKELDVIKINAHMNIKSYIITFLLCLFISPFSLSQECQSYDKLDSLISNSIRIKYDHYDSLLLVKIATLKISENGNLKNIKIDGMDYREIDYDFYINKTSALSLKRIYSLRKKAQDIEKELFSILETIERLCLKQLDVNYVLPIIIDFRNCQPCFHISNMEGSLYNFFTYGEHNHFFLKPIKVVHTDPIKKMAQKKNN